MLHQPILPPPPLERITVLQGQALVSASSHEEFTTVLGSCVATCLYDPQARVGGMNHFLLAEPPAGSSATEIDEHYGVFLMELLINQMLARGAAKCRLRAHLYGGANMRSGMAPIGSRNALFARRFLAEEGIVLVREDLGGGNARRVDFRPAAGRVRCRSVEPAMAPAIRPTARPPLSGGDVELF